MNIYLVVEGERATIKLYKSWILFVNKNLRPIQYVQEFDHDSYYVLAGYGQPGYWARVDHAIEDVNKIKEIDRLVICVDSEEKSYEEKLAEAKEHVERIKCRGEVRYIIQHFCQETWLIGNIHMFRKKPQDKELLKYLALFDVRTNDPELLTGNKENFWNRSQFAYHYFRAGIRDTCGNREFYNSHDPGIAAKEGFFYQVRKRHLDKQHISSFRTFLEAFT